MYLAFLKHGCRHKCYIQHTDIYAKGNMIDSKDLQRTLKVKRKYFSLTNIIKEKNKVQREIFPILQNE